MPRNEPNMEYFDKAYRVPRNTGQPAGPDADKFYDQALRVQAPRGLSGSSVAANPATQSNLFQAQLVAYQTEVNRRQEGAANAAQEATVRYWVETQNAGSSREPAFQFNVAFLEEPHMTHGFAVAKNHSFGDIFSDPVGSATILQWVRNDRGHYTGVRLAYYADVYKINPYITARVTLFNGKDKPPFIGVHHVSFTGLAYKPFSSAARTKIATTQPHQVEYAPGATSSPGGAKAAKPTELQLVADFEANRFAIRQFYPGYPNMVQQVAYEGFFELAREEERIYQDMQRYYPHLAKKYFPERGFAAR